MLVRLPWPGRRLLSGLSLLRPRFCSRPRGWLARFGDPRSTEELERACGGWRGQWPSLVRPGRLTGGGGSPLFLCLDIQREKVGERTGQLITLGNHAGLWVPVTTHSPLEKWTFRSLMTRPHLPGQIAIRMAVCWGVHVLGRRLVFSDWPTAGLTVGFLAQSVWKCIIPEIMRTKSQSLLRDEWDTK